MTDERNPYSVGDEIVFVPDKRTIGWNQHSFERWGVYPGYAGYVTRIDGLDIVVDEKGEAAMHWSQFRPAVEMSPQERSALREAFEQA